MFNVILCAFYEWNEALKNVNLTAIQFVTRKPKDVQATLMHDE